jgi:hypothetical protein
MPGYLQPRDFHVHGVADVRANDLANSGTAHSMTTSGNRARPACRSRRARIRADLARHVEGDYDSNARPCLGVVRRDHCRASAVGGHGPAARVVRSICTALRPPGFAVGPAILQRACATRVRPSTIRGPRDSRMGCSHAFWSKRDLGRNITRRRLARNEEKDATSHTNTDWQRAWIVVDSKLCQ